MIISIDPGITGAIALVDQHGAHEVHDMPVMEKTHGKGQQVNPYALAGLIRGLHIENKIKMVVIERVGPMPSQGVTSVFGFGKSAGIIEGVIAAFHLPMQFPTPQAWKKHFALIGRDKDAARTHAINLFPMMADSLSRKKDIGRADAILIGAYIAQKLAV